MTDRRKHKRLPIERNVEIIASGQKSWAGTSRDISFGGIFIEFENVPEIAAGEELAIHIELRGGEAPQKIEIQSRVVHRQRTGIGCQFYKIELDHYHHLKNLLVINSDDPALLLDELEKHPGLILSGK